MPSSWLIALKAWNAKKGGKYTIPKKGSPEYNEVRELMSKGAGISASTASTVSMPPLPKKGARGTNSGEGEGPKKKE